MKNTSTLLNVTIISSLITFAYFSGILAKHTLKNFLKK